MSSLNMAVLSVGQAKKRMFATSIADMIVNGAHGKTTDANCLARHLLEEPQTGKDRLAKFNTSRLMEELNVLVIVRCILIVFVNLSQLSHLVVLAVLKVLGLIGLVVLLLVAMAARNKELVL